MIDGAEYKARTKRVAAARGLLSDAGSIPAASTSFLTSRSGGTSSFFGACDLARGNRTRFAGSLFCPWGAAPPF